MPATFPESRLQTQNLGLLVKTMSLSHNPVNTSNDRAEIQSLWIGPQVSVMERLCMTSFLQNGHPFHLYVYEDVKGIPRGVELKDASRIVHPDRIFKYKDYDTYAGFANLFRYKLLLEEGGWWVDADVICLKPFPSRPEYVLASERFHNKKHGPATGRRVANCVLKTPPGARIMDYCYGESVGRNPRELTWGETGPRLITKAVETFGMENLLASPDAFCPIDCWNWGRAISGSLWNSGIERMNMVLHGSHAVHLWSEGWRRHQVDKSSVFPRNSIYEQLKRRYGIEGQHD